MPFPVIPLIIAASAGALGSKILTKEKPPVQNTFEPALIGGKNNLLTTAAVIGGGFVAYSALKGRKK